MVSPRGFAQARVVAGQKPSGYVSLRVRGVGSQQQPSISRRGPSCQGMNARNTSGKENEEQNEAKSLLRLLLPAAALRQWPHKTKGSDW